MIIYAILLFPILVSIMAVYVLWLLKTAEPAPHRGEFNITVGDVEARKRFEKQFEDRINKGVGR